MAKGFVGGVIWGAIASLSVIGVLSVLGEGPVQPDVAIVAPDRDSVTVDEDGGRLDAGADADLAVEAGASGVSQPKADDVRAAAEAGADTPTLPETGAADRLTGPAQQAESARVAVNTEVPVLPSPQAALPDAPRGESELSISTDPAQPPAPEVPAESGAFSAQAPAVDDTAPTIPQADTAGTASQDAPTVADAPQVAALPETGLPADAPAPAPETDAALDLPSALDSEPETARPLIGRPAVSLLGREDSDDAQDDTQEVPDPAPAIADGRPPIEVYAARFDDPGDKPLMSIVLIDDGVSLGGGSIGVEALGSFPYPISFAVDATLPDARSRMATYRAEGFEVLALVDMPQGARGSDAEVILNAALAAVPEAVGVLEGTRTGIQSDRAAAEQAIEALAQSGHGFLLQAQGLNTVHKLAARAGVPSAVVFRDFDSAGQTPTVIRRFLDQAAFRAGQEGRVVMLGRVRPDTISALLLWGLQDRAARVALVPVSAVLTAEGGAS